MNILKLILEGFGRLLMWIGIAMSGLFFALTACAIVAIPAVLIYYENYFLGIILGVLIYGGIANIDKISREIKDENKYEDNDND